MTDLRKRKNTCKANRARFSRGRWDGRATTTMHLPFVVIPYFWIEDFSVHHFSFRERHEDSSIPQGHFLEKAVLCEKNQTYCYGYNIATKSYNIRRSKLINNTKQQQVITKVIKRFHQAIKIIKFLQSINIVI